MLRCRLPITEKKLLPFSHEQFLSADNTHQQHRLNQHLKSELHKRRRTLVPLNIGQSVRIQDPITSLWSQKGTIVEIISPTSYMIKTEGGSLLQRTRQHIRLCYHNPANSPPQQPPPKPSATPNDKTTRTTPQTLRRSSRLANKNKCQHIPQGNQISVKRHKWE